MTPDERLALEELADMIEHSEGLIRMIPGGGTVQLGIRRTALVIAALRGGAGGAAQAPTAEQIETACAAYARATGYYVEFHRGLSSESSNLMREGMRAALCAVAQQDDENNEEEAK